MKSGVLGYKKGENIYIYIQRNENYRLLFRLLVEVKMHIFIAVLKLSRQDIYIEINPGTVMSLSYPED